MAEMANEILNKVMDEMDKFLHQPGVVDKYMTLVETTTGIKRMYIAKGLMAFFALYMIFGYFAPLLCNLLGFVYPAYSSLAALETSSKDDDSRWLTYWVVYAFFCVLEFFVDIIFSWFPLYWLAKVLFLIWCFLPIENNGTNYVYRAIIRPMFRRHRVNIDGIANDIAQGVSDIKDNIIKKKN